MSNIPDKVFVIAEAGVNHNGDPGIGRRLIDAAAAAGADAVKFQTFNADALASPAAPKAGYQKSTTDPAETQREMLRGLELTREAHVELKAHATAAGLEFMSTPFDRDSLDFLVNDLGVETVKIGSGDLIDGPLLLDAARSGRGLIVSTGMSTLDEVAQALDILAYGLTNTGDPGGRDDFEGCHARAEGAAALNQAVTLLQCTSLYPAPVDLANLRAMASLRDRFGVRVGYSDHTEGDAVALAAVALGAVVIEKHLTLDRTMAGPDHAASMEPSEFARLVAGIRAVETALGSGDKAPSEAENDTRYSARKSLVAARPVAANARFAPDDLTAKRPGDGVSPMAYWDAIGAPAARDFDTNEQIEQ